MINLADLKKEYKTEKNISFQFWSGFIEFKHAKDAEKMVCAFESQGLTMQLSYEIIRQPIKSESIYFKRDVYTSDEELQKMKDYFKDDGCCSIRNERSGVSLHFLSEEHRYAAFIKYGRGKFMIGEISVHFENDEKTMRMFMNRHKNECAL